MHTKRTGHTEFVDKTADAAKPISLEVPKVTASASEDAADGTSQTEGTFCNSAFCISWGYVWSEHRNLIVFKTV